MSAYITSLAVALPNQPIGNEQVEPLLGMIGGRSSKLRHLIQSRNGIKTRYYAIDPATGLQTHNNAQLTAEAVKKLVSQGSPDLLACGTSSADQIIPSHAAMVHGASGLPACEVVSTAGVCCSSMAALKYASMAVQTGNARDAVVTGSELASSVFRARNFRADAVRRNAATAFEQEFLRWMLSDGAGALRITPRPNECGSSLRIDWLDIVSYANELETCMYTGALKRADGSLQGWREAEDLDRVQEQGYFNLTQDLKVLERALIPVAFRQSLERVKQRRELMSEQVDWLLVHMSSEFFRQSIVDTLAACGLPMPQDKWFTNLSSKGNTGSASCFIMLEELFNSGRLKPGDRIVCAVPESARFTFAYMHLTVV